jgi:hypothetical protein
MKLFDITSQLLQLEDALENSEGVEESTLLEAQAYLDGLKIERTEKIENCVALLKNWEALETAIKAEETALKARRESLEKRADWLKNYLAYCLEPGEKLETAKCKISWRKSESIEILDEEKIPDEFFKTEIVKKVDKKAIRDTLKAGGEVEGAELREKNNLIIK